MKGRERVRGLTVRLGAELAVIVLGVWIALWADGWASERSDRRTEAARLEALDQNIRRTLATLAEEREETRQAIEALRMLATLPEDAPEGDEVGDDFLFGFLHVPFISPELHVYEDLRSSGELGLLTDPELRLGLSVMDAAFDRLVAALEDLSTVQQLNVDPYLLERIDLRPFLGGFLGLPDMDARPVADFGFLTSREARNLVLFKLDLMIQIDLALEEAQQASLRVAGRLGMGAEADPVALGGG